MSKTFMYPVYGKIPPCSIPNRLEERKNRAKALKLEQSRKPEKPEDFVSYEDSDSDEETPYVESRIMKTSYNFVDYVRSREINSKNIATMSRAYGCRHILSHEMFRETPINLGNLNKVFCSAWLSDRQVVFGTKCNKLMVYDVNTGILDRIPSLVGSTEYVPDQQSCGIHSVQINPSRTLLATGARNACDIAVYSLPTLDPVCVADNGHKDWVFDLCWLDDEFLVSGSRDTKLALWRVTSDMFELKREVPTPLRISPLCMRECRTAQKIRSLVYNKPYEEIAALSLNGYIHIWNTETFKQKFSRKLPSSQDTVCLAFQENGLYAVGCRSSTILLDCRTLQAIKKISSRYSGCGIRSISFQGDILTVGTGLGMLMFYDLRAWKHLESSINSSRTVVLKGHKGYVYPDEEYAEAGGQNVKYVPAVYTHSYDKSGTRLFTAGGPLPATLTGNYAGVWQ